MNEILMWVLIIVLAFIPITLAVTFVPFYLYNIAWRSFRAGRLVLPVLDPSKTRDPEYYHLSGIAPRIFGLACLLMGASTHLFPVVLVVEASCETCNATWIPRAVAGIWVGSMPFVISSRYWVPALSRNPKRIREPSAAQRLFFWHGVIRAVKSWSGWPDKV